MRRGEIGKRLKALRIYRGYSQEQLARKVSVARCTISKYENGGGMDANLADEVLKALGCIYVLGADLTAEESREIAKLISNSRTQRRRREKEKRNEFFKKKEKDQRINN